MKTATVNVTQAAEATTAATAIRTQAVFGTKEWASVNANCAKGCSNDCKYCYAKAMAVRFDRSKPDGWRTEVPYLGRAVVVSRRKEATRVMFPTTHDITPGILGTCLQALDLMLGAGHEVLVVSKPRLQCIQAICQKFGQYKDRILFRFTIGSTDSAVLKFWEPNAPDFHERLESLRLAHGMGFRTSVSCEPMLDDHVEAVVKAVAPFVTDSIWIGKANFLRHRLRANAADDPVTMGRADGLIAQQCDANIIALHERLKNHPLVKWKESIKKVVGLLIPVEAGQDI